MAIREARPQGHYAMLPASGDRRAPWPYQETGPSDPPKPRLLDRVRQAISARHYSRRTEKAYVHWIKRYIVVHGKRHPAEMGVAEVTTFLTSLAVQSKVAASTQNQALRALLFLYREVLGLELPWLEDVVRAKRPGHLPVGLTREEIRAVLQHLDGVPRGSGPSCCTVRACACWNAAACA
jgi:integrase